MCVYGRLTFTEAKCHVEALGGILTIQGLDLYMLKIGNLTMVSSDLGRCIETARRMANHKRPGGQCSQ